MQNKRTGVGCQYMTGLTINGVVCDKYDRPNDLWCQKCMANNCNGVMGQPISVGFKIKTKKCNTCSRANK